MNSIDRSMTIWMVVMIVMVFVILPATVLTAAYISHSERNAPEKPVAALDISTDYETQERDVFWHEDDHFIRTVDNGSYYWSAAKHTYQVAQTISLPHGVNYITKYVRANICQHGEYRHVASCCE